MKDWQKIGIGVIISLLSWAGTTIYNDIKETAADNRASIQSLIEIHLNGE